MSFSRKRFPFGIQASRPVIDTIIVWLGLAPAVAAAPSARPVQITVVSAVERALAQFPTVEAAAAAVLAAREDANVARSSRLPRLDLGGSVTRYQEPMVVTPIHGLEPETRPEFDDTLIQAALTARYTLYDGGARGARIYKADSLASRAHESLEGARQTLISRTVSTYLTVLGGSSSLAAHDRRLRALEAELSRVRRLVRVGRVAPLEMQRVEGALAAARAERVELAGTLDLSERNLARLVGAEVDEVRADRLASVSLTGTAKLTSEELRQSALSKNADVRRARQELQARQADLALARSARGPRVDLVANYVDFGSSQGNFSAEWNTGLEVKLALFDGGATSHAIAAAEASVRRAEEELRLVELEVREALDGILSELEQGQARFESLTVAVDRLSNVARIEKLRLDQGVGIETDYVNAEADLLEARAGLVWTRYQEISAFVDLLRITGELHPARLEDVLTNGV